MHNLILSLIGFSLVIGFVSLYKDLRKVKSWQVESSEPSPVVPDNSLEPIGYIEPFHPAGVAGEATGCEAANVGLGHLLENAGHFFHH